ncbi:Divergent AAA domain [Chryseobacterium taklimakanense]|uniref:Divergent AAA domain n=2 Tax=Chryseobacterium taklimakanense TaxID=536441 RepID=A0A239WC32_9FLAO|nr:Divergent AAA domain [Chryseobacterium taklimakanense]
MMSNEELKKMVDELRSYSKETTWIEFKRNDATDNQRLGRYISGLSNAARLSNEPFGYLVFGVEDDTWDVVGTTYNYLKRKEKGSDLDFYIRKGLTPSIYFEVFPCDYNGDKLIIFKIPACSSVPTEFENVAYIRIDSHLTELKKFPEHLKRILNSDRDWSAEIVEKATINDLDADAIAKAKELYKEKNKNKSFYKDIDGWSDATFLDRVKVTAQGKITNTALILLGKYESAHFLSPHIAQITWKLDTEERAYEHFGMPLFLEVNNILAKIRNVQYKFFPDNQLISVEVVKYDNEVILEALNNCIAHQDYFRNSRIVVTEKINKLIFESAGGFFEGNAEDYFTGEKTPKKYRNTWLKDAMVNLNMIDSMGYGIFKMLKSQKERYFPLPDYSKSTSDEVILEIYGHSLDENYSKLLIENKDDLHLTEVVLLDKVQKKQEITDPAAKLLRNKGLIEGRKPNYHISSSVASVTGKEKEYLQAKGIEDEYCRKIMKDYMLKFNGGERSDFENLLKDKLPDVLNEKQKKDKVKNLLQAMKRNDEIYLDGKTWRLKP